MKKDIKRVFLIVLDSVGCGEMPDSADFGDAGSNTLKSISRSERFFAPNMISGATMTSNGYRDAVSNALQAFTLASGGKLDPAIALEAKIPELAPGFVNPAAVEASGSLKKALKASNDAGFAYICIDGKPVGKVKVVFEKTVEQKIPEKKNFWDRIFGGKQ